MSVRYLTSTHLWGTYIFIFLALCSANKTFSQKYKADSLRALLAKEKKDTNSVRVMWQMADAVSLYSPDSALQLAQRALFLAKNINYEEGQSRALSALANTFIKIGNYPRSLELNIQKLQLEEKRGNPRNLSSVLINIGIVHVLQEEYLKALQYYSQADSVIRLYNVQDMKYYIAFNLGDIYDRLNQPDSSYKYFHESLVLANESKDGDLIGSSLTGLGHSFQKLKNYQESLHNYQTAISYLQMANDDDMLCEATLGIAKLHQKLGNMDSAAWYATLSLAIAKKDNFLSHQLNAAEFMTNHYKINKNIDSAFSYVNHVQELNDSLNSKSRIRESQILASNEQLRQLEIEENKRLAKAERSQQLQLLAIGILIPALFMLTILLSRVKIHVQAVKILGIFSLLLTSEYLTLLLHPYVQELTHHSPALEVLIFVAIAALLIPSHHKIEHWLIEKIMRNRLKHGSTSINLKTIKIKMKDPSA